MNIAGVAVSLLIIAAPLAVAESFEVGQKDNKFSVDSLEIKVGDTVNFKNNDDHFHNIYSLSDVQIFDLGSFPKGESRSVKFEKAGEVEVECAIHPDMYMTIQVNE